MAIGADASVPITRSTVHTTTSPARASRPDFADRIFSLIVFGSVGSLPEAPQHTAVQGCVTREPGSG